MMCMCVCMCVQYVYSGMQDVKKIQKLSMYVSVYVGEEHLESGHPSHSRRGGGDC